jgi:hypothetical protein
MNRIFWVYLNKMSTAMMVTGVDKLVSVLSGVAAPHEVVNVVEGRSRYRVSARVISHLANTVLSGHIGIISALGESLPVEDPQALLEVLRKFNTERLYLDGETVRTTGTAYNTVFRHPKGD